MTAPQLEQIALERVSPSLRGFMATQGCYDELVGADGGLRSHWRLIADLYGPQHVLCEGVVPPELVFTHLGFLRCGHGLKLPGGRWLHFDAAVIARNQEGRWLALGDRTGVPHGLGYTIENRSVVRNWISIDSWEIVLRVWCDGFSGNADLLPLLDTLMVNLSAFAGLGTESMMRRPGWRFLDMGRRIERADEQRLDEMLIESDDGSMTHHNPYLGTPEAAPLIDLRVIDQTNPRSSGFQIAARDGHATELAQDESSPVLLEERRAIMAVTNRLRLADVAALAHVDADGTRSQLSPPALAARIVFASLFREHHPPLPCACHTPTPVGRHAGIERWPCLKI